MPRYLKDDGCHWNGKVDFKVLNVVSPSMLFIKSDLFEFTLKLLSLWIWKTPVEYW